MSEVSREELTSLENRISNNQNTLEQRIYGDINSIRHKMDDVCKGQNRINERVIKIESTTERLDKSFEKQNAMIEAKFNELPDIIIKEITRIALTKEGRELFRNRLNIELGSKLSWVLGITITAIITVLIGICFAT